MNLILIIINILFDTIITTIWNGLVFNYLWLNRIFFILKLNSLYLKTNIIINNQSTLIVIASIIKIELGRNYILLLLYIFHMLWNLTLSHSLHNIMRSFIQISHNFKYSILVLSCIHLFLDVKQRSGSWHFFSQIILNWAVKLFFSFYDMVANIFTFVNSWFGSFVL